MAIKPPIYTLEDGAILRHGEPAGRYDIATGEILDLSDAVPVQIRAVLKGIIRRRLGLNSEPEKKEPEPQPHATEIPPAPEMDPRLGDKTPAYMEWLAKFHPDKFEKQYKSRRTFLTASPAINPMPPLGGDIPETSMAAEAKEVWLKKR